jgi:hypothetical protein
MVDHRYLLSASLQSAAVVPAAGNLNGLLTKPGLDNGNAQNYKI